MNLRLFSIALLISAVPIVALAESGLVLNHGDFVAAERITRAGEAVVSLKLSKSGKAKLRKLGASSVDRELRPSALAIAQTSE